MNKTNSKYTMSPEPGTCEIIDDSLRLKDDLLGHFESFLLLPGDAELYKSKNVNSECVEVCLRKDLLPREYKQPLQHRQSKVTPSLQYKQITPLFYPHNLNMLSGLPSITS